MMVNRISGKRGVILSLLCLCGLWALRFRSADEKTPADKPAASTVPQYTANGELKFPEDFRTWVFVGATLGLSYSEHADDNDEQQFTNVYIAPDAYLHYERTGEFPEKTILAMAVYPQNRKQPQGDLKLQGSFEGDLLAVEVAVKDGERFDDGWAYFDFSPQEGQTQLRQTSTAFPTKKCYDCHLEHAADDNVFVQYYPVLRRLLKNKPVK
jgi:hypothetical protein